MLLPEARTYLADAGADVDEESQMVLFDRGLVERSVASAPETVEILGRSPERNALLGGRHITAVPVWSPPAVSDLDGGKRSGNLADFRDLVRLTQHFDVIHLTGPASSRRTCPSSSVISSRALPI